MRSPVVLSLRFSGPDELAAGWDLFAGTLSVEEPLPPAGSLVILDGRVGDAAFLLQGRVRMQPGGRRVLALDAAAYPLVEALVEPPKRQRKGRRAVA